MRTISLQLHPQAQLEAVATAIAISTGAKTYLDGKSARVPSLRLMSSPTDPVMAVISFIDGEGEARQFNYHFEFGSAGHRGVMLSASPLFYAVALQVAKGFGGEVKVDEGEHLPLVFPSNWPKDYDDAGFDALRDIISSLKPVTEAALEDAKVQLQTLG